MPTFDPARKGVYHSELVKATEANGPLKLILKGDVLNSKNKDLLGMVYFQEVGDEKDHYYNIESAAIREQLQRAPRDVVLSVSAGGHGKDHLTHVLDIQALGVAAPSPAPSQPAAQTPAPAAPANGASHGTDIVDYRPRTIMKLEADCFLAAAEIVGHAITVFDFLEGAGPDACLATTKEIAASMFIESNRQAGLRPLRAKSSKWVLVEEDGER